MLKLMEDATITSTVRYSFRLTDVLTASCSGQVNWIPTHYREPRLITVHYLIGRIVMQKPLIGKSTIGECILIRLHRLLSQWSWSESWYRDDGFR